MSGVAYSHDARGNLTSDGARTFGYDLENRLQSVSGAGAMALAYDPLGRLSRTSAGGVETNYVYDGDALIGEYRDSGTLLRRYVHGPGVDEPLVWYEGAGTSDRRWLVGNQQGSVIGVANASGSSTQTYAYGPYGEPANDNWAGARFRYTGQITLPEAKLYHYKARVYDPGLGRFLQTDPVGYESDFNLYAYAYNDPLNLTDPNGEEPRGYAGRAGDGRVLTTSDNYRSSFPNRPPPVVRLSGRAAGPVGAVIAVVGALFGSSTQTQADDAGFSSREQATMQQAESMLRSPGMHALQNAAEQGIVRSTEIGGVSVTVDPGLSGGGALGMTNTKGGGFYLAPEAFGSQGTLAETVLHELHRVNTSEALSSGQVSGEAAARETLGAADFAARAREFMFRERQN